MHFVFRNGYNNSTHTRRQVCIHYTKQVIHQTRKLIWLLRDAGQGVLNSYGCTGDATCHNTRQSSAWPQDTARQHKSWTLNFYIKIKTQMKPQLSCWLIRHAGCLGGSQEWLLTSQN